MECHAAQLVLGHNSQLSWVISPWVWRLETHEIRRIFMTGCNPAYQLQHDSPLFLLPSRQRTRFFQEFSRVKDNTFTISRYTTTKGVVSEHHPDETKPLIIDPKFSRWATGHSRSCKNVWKTWSRSWSICVELSCREIVGETFQVKFVWLFHPQKTRPKGRHIHHVS